MADRSSNIEKQSMESENDYSAEKGPLVGMRHIQAVLVFFLAFETYSVKSCLSTAIVAMTKTGSSPNPDIPVYDWDNNSVILSSLLWGYVVFQVYAGHISKTHGPKWFLFGAICLTSAISVFMPLCAEHFGSYGMIVCRVIQGLALGFVFPALHGYIGMWVPKEEISTLGSFMLGGCYVGNIFGTIVAGYLSASWWGWPSIFYLLGILGFVWCLLWAFFGFNSPEVHPYITDDEKKYIMSSMGHIEGEVVAIPWKAILTSVPFYAIVVANLGAVWVVNTFMMESPTYMVNVLGVSVDQAGTFSILGSALSPLAGFSSGIMSDRIIASGKFRIITVRKTFHAVATFGPAILYTILGFVPSDQTALNIFIITLAAVMGSLIINSLTINYMDLSPKFAGVMLGISNGIGQLVSIAAPLLVQFTITDESDITQWRVLFLTTAGIVVIGAMAFLLFASDQRQWWNEGLDQDKKEKDEKKY